MSTSAAIRAGQMALQQCQDSLAVLAAQSKANTVIADYNSNQLAQCAAQDNANIRDYNNRCDDLRRKRDDWRNCWNRKYEEARNWEGYYECQNCEGHQYAVRDACNCGDPGWACKRFSHWCKNTEERCRQEANDACGAQEPSTDCGPPPPKVACALKEQNNTQVNVNCCPNISIIAGSDVNTTTISQQTDCLNKQKQQLLENTGSETSSTTKQPTQQTPTKPQPTIESTSTTIIMIVIAVIIVIILIMVFILFTSKPKPEYHAFMPPRSVRFRLPPPPGFRPPPPPGFRPPPPPGFRPPPPPGFIPPPLPSLPSTPVVN